MAAMFNGVTFEMCIYKHIYNIYKNRFYKKDQMYILEFILGQNNSNNVILQLILTNLVP